MLSHHEELWDWGARIALIFFFRSRYGLYWKRGSARSLSIGLLACLCYCLYHCPFVWPSISLSVYLTVVWPLFCFSIGLSIHLSIYQWITITLAGNLLVFVQLWSLENHGHSDKFIMRWVVIRNFFKLDWNSITIHKYFRFPEFQSKVYDTFLIKCCFPVLFFRALSRRIYRWAPTRDPFTSTAPHLLMKAMTWIP